MTFPFWIYIQNIQVFIILFSVQNWYISKSVLGLDIIHSSTRNTHNVHWGINLTPFILKNTTHFFLAKPPLKSANCPRPCFLGNPPYILVFREPLPWNSDYSVNLPPTPKKQSFSSFTPSHLLKVTKFLLKIPQFEFLVTTEQSVLVYKLFLSLNMPDFIFLLKNCNPPSPEQSHHLFPRNPLFKNFSFLKIW